LTQKNIYGEEKPNNAWSFGMPKFEKKSEEKRLTGKEKYYKGKY